MFDFGDLLAMPILTALDDSQKWILDFVEAASEGSLSMFEAAMTHSQQQAIVSCKLIYQISSVSHLHLNIVVYSKSYNPALV